ncbi:hypothetical protein JCM21714_2630 [Gracilibacillus boraciitolerans JCM 21714]|uniref:Glutaredoxin domain-containing protein n=1 Tax=Gracilibacillus boraciitolerans JCM 21714 TaxID=1298598 RepID=W4VL39_9BACI|nr:glutaredoxin domain-containing protein [Gracilibacillus boraciitolerans]GAE93543.1 hypothetical protein JCM21714_2630 [Gracilibacillus boraciitolerans JCM 21714]
MEKQQIDIYISNNCNESNEAIDYLTQRNIDFSIKNISQHKEYLYELHQQEIYITPAIIIDKNHQILGFQQNKITELIKA